MMLLHLLLHVLIFQLLHAKGGQKDVAKAIEQKPMPPSKDMNYEIKHLENCDNTGFYFVTEHYSNEIESDECFLCFCENRNTAVCWKRESKRCHKETEHHGLGPRDTRKRRSPGFSDIFFRDASRDVFNRNSEDKQCKPYESSFSDDCPPADWCTGCTVCDCDANGRWDCHILSFCSDPKKNKRNGRNMVRKKPTTTPLPYAARPRTGPPIMRRGHHHKKHHASPQKKVVKKSVPPSHPQQKQHKKKPPIRYKRIASKPNVSPNKFKKRNISSQKPVHIYKQNRKHSNVPNHITNYKQKNTKEDPNDPKIPVDVAQTIVKQMMSAVQKLVKKEIYNMTKLVQDMQQRSMPQIRNDMTTYSPRIIGGTMRRKKRQIEKVTTEEGSQLKILDGEYKRNLSTQEASYLTSTVSSSTKGVLEERQVNSTTLKNNSNSLSLNTEAILVIPMSTTTDSKNDYYKYIVATNIIPLSNNNTLDVNTLKTTTVSETNITNVTEKMTENIEITATRKTETHVNVSKSIVYNRPKDLSLNNTQINNRNLSETSDNTLINTTKAANGVTSSSILLDNINDTYKYIAKVNNTGGDIKFNFWRQVEVRDKNIKLLTGNAKNVTAKVNKTGVIGGDKHKVHGKDINRITVTKKYNLYKTLNYHRCPFLNKIALNTNKTHNVASSNTIFHKKYHLTNMLSEFNNSKEQRKNFKKFNFMRYLRTIMNRIFKRKKSTDRFSRYHILETLCEHFGPCRIKSKDKYVLKAKLADLDNETMAILKTVKIIKGLLKLLDDSVEKNKSLSKQGQLGSDIQKLNSIIKGTYGNNFKESLTETQITQIEYIKKNTQDFVKSVGKFAISLNQILAIVSKQDNNDNYKNIQHHIVGKDPFQSLRDLLVKYNLVQNNFMKKMYELVNSFENKMHDKPKVSAAQDMNSSIAIENFSRNILKNLRKLKHLAQTLNYNGRTKRETKDDDAIEYLLMLMEYLLKQNHPLDAAPANDGIDLLIEAIKNAPDIKSVRKKVLVNIPSSGIDTTVMSISRNLLYRSTTGSSVIDADSERDTASNEDSEKSKDDINEDILKTKIEENKDLFDIAEEEKDSDDRIQLDRRAEIVLSGSDSNTKAPFYEEIDTNVIPHSLNEFEPTESPQLLKEEDSNNNSSLNYASDNENGYTDNSHNANNIYYDNTESANVFSNTVNYGTNAVYSNNNYDINSSDGNVYIANLADGKVQNVNAGDSDTYNVDTLDQKNNSVTTAYENVDAVKGENSDIAAAEESLKGGEDSVKKIETVYTGEMDEDETTTTTISMLEAEIVTTVSPEEDNPKKKYKSKVIKTLDSYDNEKNNDKKSKLEWIEENFRREYSNYEDDKVKSKEEKREDTKIYTTVAAPSRTSKPEFNKKRVADVSLISNEVETREKKKKSKINTEEVMYKKQMDLLNSLDYVTEKAEFEENESKDGNAEERYSENFPAYFV